MQNWTSSVEIAAAFGLEQYASDTESLRSEVKSLLRLSTLIEMEAPFRRRPTRPSSCARRVLWTSWKRTLSPL